MSSSSIRSMAIALGVFGTAARAHMIMGSPIPYGKDVIDNSPLTSSNFPCKATEANKGTFYSRDGIDNTWPQGSTQKLSFVGSAVHGGGSCQLALTEDLAPSKSTSWQVILSIEGGCPSTDGSGPSVYDFKVPESIAPGEYSFAWTWISKLAGQPEYYMNCAPITVTGGATKRSAADNNATMLVARDEFPELFVANLADINSCKTVPGTDPEYPNAGPNVQRPDGTRNYAKIDQTGCVPVGATEKSTGSAAAAPAAPAAGSKSASASAAPASSSTSSPASGSSATATTTTTIAAPSTFLTSVVASVSVSARPVTSSSSMSMTATPTNTALKSSSTAVNSTSTAVPSAGGLGGACSTEGTFNCDGKSYQQCASGAWSAMQPLPAGTTCKTGQSTSLWKRSDLPGRLIGRRI